MRSTTNDKKEPNWFVWCLVFIFLWFFITILSCSHLHGKQGELCYQQAVTGQVICPSEIQKKLDENVRKTKAKQNSSAIGGK